MPSKKSSKTKSDSLPPPFVIHPCDFASGHLSLRDATDWIASIRTQVRALSEATILLSSKERVGIRDLWGAIDAQFITALDHIYEAQTQLIQKGREL